MSSIEGYPVIIRFKTIIHIMIKKMMFISIEGYPVIIRFKTKDLQETSFGMSCKY